MTSVGSGVREIRIQTGSEHRILYVASFAEAICILHAFERSPARLRNVSSIWRNAAWLS